ncbi:MAG: asparagine synthase (glutamine-hydrolyzing) [Phycisphaerales bacterium]
MCGIVGIATSQGRSLSLDRAGVLELSNHIAHRGPDAAGAWSNGHVAIAHRRLSVIDTSQLGAQPMTSGESPTPRLVLAYNGELYNDAELRHELGSLGVRFRSSCDTETVLRAIEVWGTEALHRLRGMFALSIYDTRLRLLTLARDPLGIKPMYFAQSDGEVIFASEPTPILAHPRFSARPNLPMVSAYATTIRTVLGNETLFEGIKALAPGQILRSDLSGDRPVLNLSTWWEQREAPRARSTRDVIADSVRRHLRSDVPTCALLSGGLDSTITATLAHDTLPDLRTYCAGAPSDDPDDDLHHARRVARTLATNHAEAIIDEPRFHERWSWMIDQLGVPLSTPNEVAIYTVASRLRADGCVVTISGEGADELFAGYAIPLDAASAFVDSNNAATSEGGGEFELSASAWIPIDFKPGVFLERVLRAAGHDDFLRSFYAEEFDRAAQETEREQGGALDAHLALHRRINLTGLLGRLDTATMLASVEGRTPFADIEVLRHASSLPMDQKYQPPPHADGGVALATAHRTKIALRRAFADVVPIEVLNREKASFPLPFQKWVPSRINLLRESRFASQIFRNEAIEAVCASPERLWALAWPMTNLALWGERWWG